MNFIKINAKDLVNLDMVKKLELTETAITFVFTMGANGTASEFITEQKANMPKSAVRKLESDFE